MGNTELILSTHKDVINPSCIECKFFILLASPLFNEDLLDTIKIHHFDDRDPTQTHITPSSWFYRFTLTWEGSEARLQVRF